MDGLLPTFGLTELKDSKSIAYLIHTSSRQLPLTTTPFPKKKGSLIFICSKVGCVQVSFARSFVIAIDGNSKGLVISFARRRGGPAQLSPSPSPTHAAFSFLFSITTPSALPLRLVSLSLLLVVVVVALRLFNPAAVGRLPRSQGIPSPPRARVQDDRFLRYQSFDAQQQQQRPPPPPRTRQVNPAPPSVPAPSAPPMPPQPTQVPPAPPSAPVPVTPPGAVPPNQPPPAPEAVATTKGPETVDPPRASASGAPPPLPPEETLIEEAIRLTRGRLRRRMAGGSGPPAS